MGWLGNLWGKVKTLGSKVGRGIQRIGNKGLDIAEKVVSTVEKIPVLRDVAAPATALARTGIGMGRKVTDLAGRGAGVFEAKSVGEAAKAAAGFKKHGQATLGDLKSDFEKGKKQSKTLFK